MLKETKSELEHAIAETERPLRYRNEVTKNTISSSPSIVKLLLVVRINNECVKNREARISIDLVKDEVENSLEREVENIKTYQQRMQKMLAKVRFVNIRDAIFPSSLCR